MIWYGPNGLEDLRDCIFASYTSIILLLICLSSGEGRRWFIDRPTQPMPGLGLLVHLSLIWDWLSGRLGDLCSCIMIVLVVDKSNN